ncbi:MAG TPA: sulfotransferase [Phycisphaerales bacterium]|nr:sulfotransferase [Phycisphaerales bacterium]
MSQTLQNAAQLLQAGKPLEAASVCREALRLNPADVRASIMLGQIARQTGDAAEAVRIFQQLRQARPGDSQIAGELGASLSAANLHGQALPLLEQAARDFPTAVQWKVWLGSCHLKLFNTVAAIRVLGEARELAPDSPEVAIHLANALLTGARPNEAEPLIRGFLERHPDSVAAMLTLAGILEHMSRLDEASGVLRRVLALRPGFEPALAGLARLLRAQGKYKDALALLEPVAGGEPTANQAMAIAPIYLAEKRFEECRALFEKVLAQDRLPEPVRASLNFGLGQACQGLKEYDAAFRAFKRANDLFPKSFNRQHRLRLYKEIRDVFSAESIRTGPRAGVDAGRCVFIVGMPRSGTTLVEQIIDAHPRAFGAGELVALPETVEELARRIGGQAPACLAKLDQALLDEGGRRYLGHVTRLAPQAERITDKLPHNFEMIGLISRMLPGARVIHCRRDPIDNCVSCYFTQLSAWHSYSNDLSHLGWAYGQYERLMEHWRFAADVPMLDVRYEDVVADIETHARRIIGFLGLEWDERCLRFYEGERAVTTASVDQVRQPIYRHSVARWKRYGAHLKPLIESLRAAGVALDEA